MKLNIFNDAEKFLLYCKTGKRLSNDSIKAYSFDIAKFNTFIKTLEPPILDYTDITKETLDQYVSYLNNYAAKTIRRKLAGLRSFYAYLEYEGRLKESPFLKFKLQIRDAYKLRTSMTVDEISTLLKAAYGSKPYARIYKLEDIKAHSRDFIWIRDVTVLELLFAGGMRVSELCSIKFQDVSLSEMAILIHGKGNKERLMYLENPEVVRAIKEYWKVRQNIKISSPYLFITKNLEQLSTSAVRNLVSKYTREAGISKNITPHVFRHTFATLLLEEGVDIKYIQDFLGHSSITTTQLYLHTSDKEKRKIIAAKHPRGYINMEENLI